MCEVFEQAPDFSDDWFNAVCGSDETNSLFGAFFQHTKLTATEEGQEGEDYAHLGTALLAAFNYVPVGAPKKLKAQKQSVSRNLSAKLLEPGNAAFIDNWLALLRHPTSCINVLKAMYPMCMSSPAMCAFIARREQDMTNLFDLLSEKVL